MSDSVNRRDDLANPRLGIDHFLLWIAGTCLSLAVVNSAFPVTEFDASAWVEEQARRTCICCAYGAGLGIWSWLAYHRLRGKTILLRQPGHVLLVLCSAMAILDLGLTLLLHEALSLKLIPGFAADDLRFFYGYLIGLGICLASLWSECLGWTWRLAIACLILRCAAFVGLMGASFTGYSELHWATGNWAYFLRDALQLIQELSGPLVVISTLVAAGLEVREWRNRDWMHHAGVGFCVLLGLVAAVGELKHAAVIKILWQAASERYQ